MKLSHTGHYEMDMEDYQIDRFKGDWETYSYGKFRDFNLMLKGIRGDLYFREVQSICKLHLEKDSNIIFLFVIDGEVEVNGVVVKKEECYITDINILDVTGDNTKIYYGFIKEWE